MAARLLLALFGPTSSGKTALSVNLAERVERDLGRRVVVISADSRQVYRYMDIGTSKTTPAEMRGIRHELLDVLEPVHKLELEEYARLARTLITETLDAGDVPFLVGGTGVYLKSLLEGWELDGVGAARQSLRRDFPRALAADAHAMLRRLDRAAAARVHPNNYDAVINALAGVMAPARSAGPPARVPPQAVVLGVDPGATVLDQRVARTYDGQVARGLYEEVIDLAERYGLARASGSNQVLQTHGYREYFEVARERGRRVARLTDADRAEVRRRVVEHIRAYTRRQRSWFRKLPGVVMVRSAGSAFETVTRAQRARP